MIDVTEEMIEAGCIAGDFNTGLYARKKVIAIYLAMHNARPLPTDEEVGRAARAICEADGYDPEYLEPGDDPYQGEPGYPSPCIDGYNRKDEPCHFIWRRYDKRARAALIAGRG